MDVSNKNGRRAVQRGTTPRFSGKQHSNRVSLSHMFRELSALAALRNAFTAANDKGKSIDCAYCKLSRKYHALKQQLSYAAAPAF